MSTTFELRQQAIIDGRRRAILITGAASGIGLATARLFAQKGWFIVALDANLEDTDVDPATQRSRPGLKSLEKELGGPANVYIAQVDVSKKDAFDAVIAELEKRLPELTNTTEPILDIIYANAGVTRGGLWAMQPFEQHLETISTNFIGIMVTIYSSLKLIKGNRGGMVFSTGSSSSLYGGPGAATYSASKHAIKGLTESLAIELGTLYGLRVADIIPGFIDTPILPLSVSQTSPTTGPFRLIPATLVASTLYSAWLDPPSSHVAGKVHYYVPEELQGQFLDEVEGQGKVKGLYRWSLVEERLKKAGVVKD